MRRLDRAFNELAERGRPHDADGAIDMLERRLDLEVPRWISPMDKRPRRWDILAVAVAGIAFVVVTAGIAVMLEVRTSNETASPLSPSTTTTIKADEVIEPLFAGGEPVTGALADGYRRILYDFGFPLGPLAAGPDGRVWISVPDVGVIEWWAWGWTIHRADAAMAPNLEVIYSVAVSADGTVWFGTADGVVWYDGYVWNVVRLPNRSVQVEVGPDGTVWASVDQAYLASAFRFNGSTFEPCAGHWAGIYTTGAFAYGDAGDVWGWIAGDWTLGIPGHWDAACVMDSPEWESGSYLPADKTAGFRPPGHSARFVKILRLGPDGSLWIVSDTTQVSHLTADGWETIEDIAGGIPQDASMAQFDADGRLWIVGRTRVATLLDGEWSSSTMGSETIRGFAIVGDLIWVSYGDTLAEYYPFSPPINR